MTRKWIMASVASKTYPFSPKDTVYVAKNDLLAVEFTQDNFVVLQPSDDLKHHCFLLKAVLPHYLVPEERVMNTKTMKKLDACWERIARRSSSKEPTRKRKKS